MSNIYEDALNDYISGNNNELTIKKSKNSYAIIDSYNQILSELKYYDFNLDNFDWILVADVETDPYHRNKGLATRIMNELYNDITTKYPNKGLYLFVRIENEVAIKFYEKIGFIKVKNYELKDGWYIIMCKGNANIRQFDNRNFS